MRNWSSSIPPTAASFAAHVISVPTNVPEIIDRPPTLIEKSKGGAELISGG